MDKDKIIKGTQKNYEIKNHYRSFFINSGDRGFF